MPNALIVLKTFQPGPRARLKAQTARAIGKRAGSAAQNAQALLVEVLDGRGVVFFFHAPIVKGQGDAPVSVGWQLCDRTGPYNLL